MDIKKYDLLIRQVLKKFNLLTNDLTYIVLI